MPAVIIIGTQWGDEGKGMVVDLFSEQADFLVRYQGGNNAGHTVVVGDETTILHHIPSGILHDRVTCVIGDGVVVNPKVLIEEMDRLIAKGRLKDPASLLISDRAHVIMPWHIALDAAAEDRMGAGKIGTTGRGIGPAYKSKIGRYGLRFGALIDRETLSHHVREALPEANFLLTEYYKRDALDADAIVEEYGAYAKRLAPHAANTYRVVGRAVREKKNVLFEGAQGTMLDIDHGTYPFVTSSNTVAGGACTGGGVGPRSIDKVLGVMKTYTTRVGGGPFPTELTDDIGEHLVQKGHEFGSTTGRRRRCGWLDLVVVRYAVELSDITGLVVTKLDVLDGLPELKVAVGYEIDGKNTDEMPADLGALTRAKPIYETLPGWTETTTEITRYEDLPANARSYLEFCAKFLGVSIDVISIGPKRSQTVTLANPFA